MRAAHLSICVILMGALMLAGNAKAEPADQLPSANQADKIGEQNNPTSPQDHSEQDQSQDDVSSDGDKPHGEANPKVTKDHQPKGKIQTPTLGDDEDYPEILTDLNTLPFPVRRMRELILEAAQSGKIEKLRQLIGFGNDVTMLSLGGIDEDPIDFLKSLSGDEQGHEILAILSEVLEAGFVHIDKGLESEMYVWPYFFAWPLSKLNDQQRVELYRLITHGDYEDMQSFGAYIFYRVGITPQGRWRFFVAGD